MVPFVNVYTGPADRVPYDPSNPHHRLQDPDLRQKLMTEANKEQLLVWVVRGAVEWYQIGLGEQFELLKNALQGYIHDNDVLHQFITEQCLVRQDGYVSVAEFRASCMSHTGRSVSSKVLQEMMMKRHFCTKVIKIQGKSARVLHGLSWNDATGSTTL